MLSTAEGLNIHKDLGARYLCAFWNTLRSSCASKKQSLTNGKSSKGGDGIAASSPTSRRFKNGTVARLAEIRKELATFVNADVEECVLITNTTHGVNHVLRNFQFNAGDVIITSEYRSLPLSSEL